MTNMSRDHERPWTTRGDTEMSQIEDLVAAYRILAEFGVIDAYGHVSVRSENDPGRYLLSRSLAPEVVTEADIIEYDLDTGQRQRARVGTGALHPRRGVQGPPRRHG